MSKIRKKLVSISSLGGKNSKMNKKNPKAVVERYSVKKKRS